MNYSHTINKLAGAYYTDARGVIFAILRASGVNAAAAFAHAYINTDLREEQRERRGKELETGQYMQELIAHLKGAKKTPIIIQDTTTSQGDKQRTKNNNNNKEKEEKKVLQTFSEVREALAAVAGEVEGKDKASVLVQLSKMIPEERREEEKRVKMYLPFNSDCKQCTLYLRSQQDKDK